MNIDSEIARQKDHPEANKYSQDRVAQLVENYFRVYLGGQEFSGDVDVFLVGSRARETNRINSDWDIVLKPSFLNQVDQKYWFNLSVDISRGLRRANIPIEVNVEEPERIFKKIGQFQM